MSMSYYLMELITSLIQHLMDSKATIAFNAIAGDLTSIVLTAMPRKSIIHVYGALGGQSVNSISLGDLIFQGKTLTGLWLTEYLNSLSSEETLEEKLKFYTEIHSNLESCLKSKIQKVFNLEKYQEDLELYNIKSSDGKILFNLN